jgi:hypothetical protein
MIPSGSLIVNDSSESGKLNVHDDFYFLLFWDVKLCENFSFKILLEFFENFILWKIFYRFLICVWKFFLELILLKFSDFSNLLTSASPKPMSVYAIDKKVSI